jgi:hypothetical protein
MKNKKGAVAVRERHYDQGIAVVQYYFGRKAQ